MKPLTYLIRTACSWCGLTWLKPWDEPVDDTGEVQNHSMCQACFDRMYPNTSAVAKENAQ